MAKMTKAQAKRRLQESKEKILKVWLSRIEPNPVKLADVEAVEKVVARCLKRLG